MSKIQPRILKGFRDILPGDELLRREIVRNLELTFRSFGFLPIDTPALEYAEILLGKGGGETDKQVYRFADKGKRDVAMRFDLTVPFARFMAMHEQELPTPFRRYHMAKVWRGENTQRGRYREFMQCDFDIVGTDHYGADVEILAMMSRSIENLAGPDFTIRLAHRGLFNSFLEKRRIAEKSVDILRAVDKLGKIGDSGVRDLLGELVSESEAGDILSYIAVESTFDATLAKITELAGGENEHSRRLKSIHAVLEDTGAGDRFLLDPSITRGLDYYTGIVYETFLTGREAFGSVCSGGRYNNLASLYTDREIPGVGASIGLDRLIAALAETDALSQSQTIPEVVVFNLEERLLSHYFTIAERVRDAGFSCSVFFEKKKLGQQFNRAEKLGSHIAVICGEDEFAAGSVSIKHLASRQSSTVPLDAAISTIRTLLNGSETTSRS